MSHALKILFAAAILFNIGRAEAQVAASYALADNVTGYVLDAYKPDDKRQVASLTKIATAKVVLDYAAKAGLDLAQPSLVPPPALNQSVRTHPTGHQDKSS